MSQAATDPIRDPIIDARDKAGLTNAQLAREIGVQRSDLSNALNGNRPIPEPMLLALCERLRLALRPVRRRRSTDSTKQPAGPTTTR